MQNDIFGALQSLVGRWQDTNTETVTYVEFRMSANNTVLVETWNWPEKKVEALTLYHMDGPILMATHYCPVGNQPKLVLDTSGDSSKITFKFVSASNLVDPTTDHNVEFWFQLADKDTFVRGETYVENTVADTWHSTYRRV